MVLEELKFRKALCENFIKIIETMDDPRKDEAIAEYNRQLSILNTEIEKLELVGPESIVVNLKSATLTGTTK